MFALRIVDQRSRDWGFGSSLALYCGLCRGAGSGGGRGDCADTCTGESRNGFAESVKEGGRAECVGECNTQDLICVSYWGPDNPRAANLLLHQSNQASSAGPSRSRSRSRP